MSETHTPAFKRAVIALNGGPSDARIVRLVAEQATLAKAELIAIHVVEIDWTLPLDADIAGRSEERPAGPRHRPRPSPRNRSRRLEPVLLQARDVGAAIVDEAAERGADLIVLGVPFRTRFGGEFAIGRTIPYVLQNAPCAVWVVREPMPEEPIVKIVIVGCGRVGAAIAEAYDAAGHEVAHPRPDDRCLRPPAGRLRRARRPRRRDRRGRPASRPGPRARTSSWP